MTSVGAALFLLWLVWETCCGGCDVTTEVRCWDVLYRKNDVAIVFSFFCARPSETSGCWVVSCGCPRSALPVFLLSCKVTIFRAVEMKGCCPTCDLKLDAPCLCCQFASNELWISSFLSGTKNNQKVLIRALKSFRMATFKVPSFFEHQRPKHLTL